MISIKQLYDLYLKHPVITTDSRKITGGSIFFALKGDLFNGNLYAEEALRQGSAFAVVDDPAVAKNDHFLLVADVLKTLQELASYHRSTLQIPVIGITGTNGKTTTKELVNAVLSKKFKTLATQSNLNNHIGVPLTILSISKDTEIAIIEMGANHQGEIRFLCGIAQPDHGMITNIGKAHLEGFGGYEGVIRAKTEMYEFLYDHEGIAFVNSDDPLLMEKASMLKLFRYGTDPSAEVFGEITRQDPFVELKLTTKKGTIIVSSHLFGGYNFPNLLAAAAIGDYFGVNENLIRDAIEEYVPSNNRSQVSHSKTNLLILDAYNANPSSMKAALENFAGSAYDNKTLILGDMLELGNESEAEHLNILLLIEELKFNSVYLIGPFFTRLCSRNDWVCFQDSDLASLWFGHHRIENATILVKGSRGIRLEKVVGML